MPGFKPQSWFVAMVSSLIARWWVRLHTKKVSEYDQEIPQSHTAEQLGHDTMRKSHRTLTATRHQEDNESKANSSLFLSKT